MRIPKISDQLTAEQTGFLKILTKSCRRNILAMTVNAQSGHPGGSLSSIDYLALIYSFIISQTGEKIVVSHGHISPAVYSILSELNYIPKAEVLKTFRKIDSVYEGHITRHVKGIWYGTGPLGIGVSVAAAFALAEKKRKSNKKVFCLLGDGEAQEGQIHEMIHFAGHNKLNNLICFVDFNKVQLTSSLKEIIDLDIGKLFAAANFNVIEVDGHNFRDMWNALKKAYQSKNQPTVIVGHTIMGKGVDFMEPEGLNHKATWHGKAPEVEMAKEALNQANLSLKPAEEKILQNFRAKIKWHPGKNKNPKLLSKVHLKTSKPILYETTEITDCRTAYGKALLDLATQNREILALTADLKGSVMTKFVSAELPEQYIECGIAEQNMISLAGGLSLIDYIPFASTFGAFMTSRAKDQARVNDINNCNVKMVATHCGLSVGEDGPTHQAIDDSGSFLGFFNTMLIEPADPNHTDRIIRYIASHYGNFYVRMGRHKFPVIAKLNGKPFYDEKYVYEYGKCDLIREGKNLTIVATGAMVHECLQAIDMIKKSGSGLSVELIAASSIKKFDNILLKSIKKTQKILTVEDHNTISGLSSQLARHLMLKNVKIKQYKSLGVEEYQLSGQAHELYEKAGISAKKIAENCLNYAKTK